MSLQAPGSSLARHGNGQIQGGGQAALPAADGVNRKGEHPDRLVSVLLTVLICGMLWRTTIPIRDVATKPTLARRTRLVPAAHLWSVSRSGGEASGHSGSGLASNPVFSPDGYEGPSMANDGNVDVLDTGGRWVPKRRTGHGPDCDGVDSRGSGFCDHPEPTHSR